MGILGLGQEQRPSPGQDMWGERTSVSLEIALLAPLFWQHV